MPVVTAAGVRLARPMISVAGQDRASLSEELHSLEVTETAAGLTRCEACFHNWSNTGNGLGFAHFDRQVLEFGKAFSVKFGTGVVFEGRIGALEAVFPSGQPPRLTVLAEDRLQDLRMTRRTRSFEAITDLELARRISSDHGLTLDSNLNGPTHRVLTQVNLSDLAFLRERAHTLDAEVWVEGRSLKFKPAPVRAAAPLPLVYGTQLREFTVLADLSTQRSSLTVSGWDVAGKRAIAARADENAIQSELRNDQGARGLLEETFGARHETLAHTQPLTESEAQTMAEAAYRLMARRFLVGRGVAEPDERIRVGARLELTGLGAIFNGTYRVCEVHHVFDAAHGLRSEFTAERPGLGRN